MKLFEAEVNKVPSLFSDFNSTSCIAMRKGIPWYCSVMVDAGGLSAHGPASKDLTIVFDSVARIGSLTDPVAIGTDFAVITAIDPNMMQDIGIRFDQFGFDLMEDVIRSNQGTVALC